MKQQQKRERHKQMIKQLLSGSQLLNSDPSATTKIKIVNNKIISNHTVKVVVVVVDYVIVTIKDISLIVVIVLIAGCSVGA